MIGSIKSERIQPCPDNVAWPTPSEQLEWPTNSRNGVSSAPFRVTHAWSATMQIGGVTRPNQPPHGRKPMQPDILAVYRNAN